MSALHAQPVDHQISILMDKARAAEAAGEIEEALELTLEARQHAQDTENMQLIGALDYMRAGQLLSLQRLEDAEEAARRAMRVLAETTGPSRFTALALGRLGESLHRQGQFLAAEEYFAAFDRLTERTANETDVNAYTRVRAMNLAGLEQFDKARDVLSSGMADATTDTRASVLLDILDIDLLAEQPARAKETLQRLNEIENKQERTELRLRFQHARLLRLTHDFGAADLALDALIVETGITANAPSARWHAALYYTSGTSKMARGLTDVARARFLTAKQILSDSGVTAGLELANVMSGVAAAEKRAGRFDISVGYLREALTSAIAAVGQGAPPAIDLQVELSAHLIQAGAFEDARAELREVERYIGQLDTSRPRARRSQILFGLAKAAYVEAQEDRAVHIETLGTLIETIENMDGPASEWLATPLTSYARVLNDAKRHKQARVMADRAVELRLAYNAFGPTKLAPAYYQRAIAEEALGMRGNALSSIRAAVDLMARYSSRLFGSDNQKALEDELRTRTEILEFAAKTAFEAGDTDLLVTSIQLANATTTEAAAVLVANKLAVADTPRARLLSKREEAVADLTALQSAGQVDPEQVSAASDRLLEINKKITEAFPETALISQAQIVTIGHAQALLQADEALFLALPTPFGTYSVLIGSTFVSSVHHPATKETMQRWVREIRRGVDPFGLLIDAEGLTLSAETLHAVYDVIFAPFELKLRGIQHIVHVPSGALQSLPPGLLLTEPVEKLDLETLSAAPWFIRTSAISVVPSVRVFSTVRQAERKAAPVAYLGIGDPILAGYADVTRGIQDRPATASGLATPSALVENLASLPETRAEILAAARVSADATTLFDADAREGKLKSMDLSRFGVLHFATHGLIASETGSFAKGVLEPSLVLTPPERATPEDDGLLTSSEIAGLDLRSPLVILSACNTASPGGQAAADGFSGLTKAFLTAGADTLVVSHWAVMSKPAAELIIGLFENQSGIGTRRTAEALRLASLAMIERPPDTAIPAPAHPVAWAPFVVVGGTSF